MKNISTNWESIFETGNENVDNQHKQLFKLVKEFSLASSLKNNKQTIAVILFKLEDYARIHFSDEEKLLSKKVGLPTKEHIRQHLEFIQFLSDLKFDYVSENKEIENELFIFLTQWLKDHILNIDQQELYLLKH